MICLSIILTAILCLGLPMLGLWYSGQPIDLQFPPVGTERHYPVFSWWAFAGLWFLFSALTLAWLKHMRSKNGDDHDEYGAKQRIPYWGYCALVLGICAWVIAWAPISGFETLRRYTFTPLWLSYIICTNAWLVARTGSCLIYRNKLNFLLLFPISGAFWWSFEWLNRFANNWIYLEAGDTSSAEYILHATICFSTVLPAVASTRELLGTWGRLQSVLARGPLLSINISRWASLLTLTVTSAAFLWIGRYPQYLFPVLWVGPLIIWLALLGLQNKSWGWEELKLGDWRDLLSWTIAALICGFFWEMWNYHSMVKWVYQVPYFSQFYVFEMPISGYLGYLPFGLECAIVVKMVRWGGNQ